MSIPSLSEASFSVRSYKFYENFLENSIRFESANETNVISAPLRQKFVCKDRLNISLHNPDPEYKDIVLEFLPEVDVQPVNTGYGYGSNGKIFDTIVFRMTMVTSLIRCCFLRSRRE